MVVILLRGLPAILSSNFVGMPGVSSLLLAPFWRLAAFDYASYLTLGVVSLGRFGLAPARAVVPSSICETSFSRNHPLHRNVSFLLPVPLLSKHPLMGLASTREGRLSSLLRSVSCPRAFPFSMYR